jgi:hypothetical protein
LLLSYCHALLESRIPGLLMLPQEKTAGQSRCPTNGRAHPGIAGERTDDCSSGSPTSPTRQRALLGFTHPGTATDDDDAH